MEFMASSDDIALIKLEHPINEIEPIHLYRGENENGQTIELVGRGATGNGLVGEYPHSPHRGKMRRAYSRVISADERWLGLRFDSPPNALALDERVYPRRESETTRNRKGYYIWRAYFTYNLCAASETDADICERPTSPATRR